MIGLDTNILVRIVAKDDPKQAKAAADFIDGGDTFFVPITVTLELEWVLRVLLKLRRQNVAKSLEALLSVRNLHFEHEGFLRTALRLYEEGFDFADALHHAGSAGCHRLATFDEDFVRRAARSALAPPVELLQS